MRSVEKLLELTAAKLGTTPERIERFVELRFVQQALGSLELKRRLGADVGP